MPRSPLENSELIKNISQDGVVPESRVADAYSARKIYELLIRDDDKAEKVRTLIQGMIDGNPPYTAEEAEKLGISVNVNWGHAEERVNQAVIPYFDMLTSVKHNARVELKLADPERARTASDIVTEEFHELLKSNPNFLSQAQLWNKNLVVFGVGLSRFRDDLDIRPYNLFLSDLKIPKNASTDVNSWDYCIICEEYTTTELYKFIRNEEVAIKNGWKPSVVKQAIINASDSGSNTDANKRTWEYHQRQLRNNSVYHSEVECKTIKVGSIYTREFSGKISHKMFIRDGIASEDNQLNDEWLYVREDAYNEFKEIINAYIADVGNGSFSGLRGLGKKVYPFGEAINRVNNSILEGAILNASLLLQPESSTDVTKLQTISIGSLKILPPGLKMVPINLSGAIGASMSVASFFQDQEGVVASSWNPTIKYNDSRRVTNKELDIAQQNRDILTNNKAEIYMQAMDDLYKEIYRRATRLNVVEEDPCGVEILAFQEACKSRGVSLAEMRGKYEVAATRSVGQGSVSNRINIMQGIGQFLTMLPEDKRNNLIRDSIAAFGGEQAVALYAPEPNSYPTGNDASIASLENNAFFNGGNIPIDRNQNHFIHATLHLEYAGGLVGQLQEGNIPPVEVARALGVLGPHVVVHMDFLSRDPSRKAQYNDLNQQLSELMKLTDQINVLAQQQLEQEQAMQQQQPEMTPELLKAQQQMQIAQQESQVKMELKARETAQRMQIRDLKTAQDIQITNAKQ